MGGGAKAKNSEFIHMTSTSHVTKGKNISASISPAWLTFIKYIAHTSVKDLEELCIHCS